jgi:DNA-binding LacI/PurR family transcriptional regulator
MPTMADIAERAGVALSTVSYVLSGKRSVSEETKQRVFQAIAELNYQPHAMARGLASRRTQTVGLVFPALTEGRSQMRLEFVAQAAEAASEQGYAFLLWSAPHNNADLLQLTSQGRVDGLILMEVLVHDPRVALLKERDFPFTLIGHCEDNEGISFVDLDFEHAAATAVAHLAGLGHRSIALINHSRQRFAAGYGPALRTQRGFEAAVRQHGLEGVSLHCEPSFQDGYARVAELLAQHAAVSALVVLQEGALGGVLQALRDAGRQVPADVSIVTVLSAHVAEMTSPPLTSIDFPAAEMGRIGTEMLIRQLEGDNGGPSQLLLQGTLSVRQSSGPYRPRPS